MGTSYKQNLCVRVPAADTNWNLLQKHLNTYSPKSLLALRVHDSLRKQREFISKKWVMNILLNEP